MDAPRKDTARKVCINFKISTFLESCPTPGGGGDKQNVTDRQTECSFIYNIDVSVIPTGQNVKRVNSRVYFIL